MAAAIRASVAAQQQEETQRAEDREEGSRPKKEEAAARVPEESRGHRRLPRSQGEGTGNPVPPNGGSAWAWGKLPAPSQYLTFPKPDITALPGLIISVGSKEASANGPVSQEAFPATGSSPVVAPSKYVWELGRGVW